MIRIGFKVLVGSILSLMMTLAIPMAIASACVCVERPREVQLKDASDIVRATIYKINPVTDYELVTLELELQVSEVWKGSRDPRLKVYMSSLDERFCGLPLAQERDYIFYVDSIRELNGDILPYVGFCGSTAEYSDGHANQLDSELGQRLIVGTTPTPRATSSPTPPLCPTSVPTSTQVAPTVENVAYLPIGFTPRQDVLEPERQASPCRTPIPIDYSNPPNVSMVIPLITGEMLTNGGIRGSWCWEPINQCNHAPGIVTKNRTWDVSSPLQAAIRMLPKEGFPDPSSWQLWVGEASSNDHGQMPNSSHWYWNPKELREVMLDPVQHSMIDPLDLSVGVVYVFKLRVSWGGAIEEPGAGWVEYGWAIERMPPMNFGHNSVWTYTDLWLDNLSTNLARSRCPLDRWRYQAINAKATFPAVGRDTNRALQASEANLHPRYP